MSIWQTKQWGEMLIKSNQAQQIFDVDGIQVEKRSLGMGQYGLFILGVSSLLGFYARGESIFQKFKKLCKQEKALFIQIETMNYKVSAFDDLNIDFIKEGYYKKFITPFTAVINLKQSEEEILAHMKPKGRYNIKLAGKKGVKILQVDKTKKNIAEFYRLMKETTSRDNFAGNSLEYYSVFLNSLDDSYLFHAYVDGVVIASGIFIINKLESVYYYGASSSQKEYRNLMAPYLLQYEAIKLAKNMGAKYYDFLGVSTPGDKNTSLGGVTDFKSKFTQDFREVSQSYIWINKRIVYTLFVVLKALKKLIT